MDFQIRGLITKNKQGAIVEYVNPSEKAIFMKNCTLHNKLKQSEKIFNGGSKFPCAYIICNDYVLIEPSEDNLGCEIRFSPKESPNWRLISKDDVKNVDQQNFDYLVSYKGKVYLKESTIRINKQAIQGELF